MAECNHREIENISTDIKLILYLVRAKAILWSKSMNMTQVETLRRVPNLLFYFTINGDLTNAYLCNIIVINPESL
jgi:hypothetical protein